MSNRLRQGLSWFKSRVISRDLQDIYLLKKTLGGDRSGSAPVAELAGRDSETGRAGITYQIDDRLEVLELIDQINPLDEQARRFARRRLQAGDKAVIACENGLPVFYGWLMFGAIEMTYGVFLPMPQSSAFAYNLFTASAHRRRGLMSGFYEFARNYLEQNGYHSLHVGISSGNGASIKAHLKTGFEKSGYFYTLKLLGTCFTLARFTHAKRFYIS